MLEGYNDFKTWCEENNKQYLLKEWDYKKNTIKPTDISETNNPKVWWKCNKCGHEWESLIRSRKKGTGCPNCAIIERTKRKSKKVKNLDTGEIFNSLTEATAKYYNNARCPTISNCCKGKVETAAGYHWEFYNE